MLSFVKLTEKITEILNILSKLTILYCAAFKLVAQKPSLDTPKEASTVKFSLWQQHAEFQVFQLKCHEIQKEKLCESPK